MFLALSLSLTLTLTLHVSYVLVIGAVILFAVYEVIFAKVCARVMVRVRVRVRVGVCVCMCACARGGKTDG